MKLLCDTNVLGELSRPRPNTGVLEWAGSVTVILLSVVTVEEVMYGLSWKPRPKTLAWFEELLKDQCEVLPVTERIARLAGSLRGQLQAAGDTRSQADLLIAATAIVHETSVVTRNTGHFVGCGVTVLNPFS